MRLVWALGIMLAAAAGCEAPSSAPTPVSPSPEPRFEIVLGRPSVLYEQVTSIPALVRNLSDVGASDVFLNCQMYADDGELLFSVSEPFANIPANDVASTTLIFMTVDYDRLDCAAR